MTLSPFPEVSLPKIPEPLYTIDQVAEAAGVSLVTLRRHYEIEGLLPEPAHRTGEKQITRRFTRAELQAVVRAERRIDGKRGAVSRALASK